MIRNNVILPTFLITAALICTSACHPASAPSPVSGNTDPQPGQERNAGLALVVVPAGTPIKVRLNSSLDTARSHPGDGFTAVLAAPIEVDGKLLAPSGANVEGAVRSAESSGRLKGRAHLSIALDSIEINGAAISIVTDSVGASSSAHKKRNLTLIGGGSGLGALIGGLAGGGGGALIGAGAGAAAGTAGAAISGKKQAHIAAESVLTFHLKQPLQLPG